MNSKDLIKKARAGDRAAFAQLYVGCKDALYRYAYFKLGNEPDAQDAVSSCVVEAYRGIAALKDEKAFKSWLFRILYRECCDILRRRIHDRSCDSIDDIQIADDCRDDDAQGSAAEVKWLFHIFIVLKSPAKIRIKSHSLHSESIFLYI